MYRGQRKYIPKRKSRKVLEGGWRQGHRMSPRGWYNMMRDDAARRRRIG